MLLIVCGINSSVAQWVQTASPNNGAYNVTVSSVLVTIPSPADTVLFAGTASGVYLSGNGGNSWNEKNYYPGVAPGSINCFAVSDTNIFAGTSLGIFLSTNNCESWSIPDSGLLTSTITSMAFSGKNIFAGILPTTSYITTPPYIVQVPGGVFLSTNNGATWSVVDSGLTDTSSTNVSALAAVGNTIVAGTTDNSGIFRSTNSGTTWTSANTGLFTVVGDSTQYIQIHALTTIGSKIFAGTDQGVFLSTNDGVSWSSASTGIPLNEFQQFPAVGCLVAAGTNLFAGMNGEVPGGVYLSTNSGASWTWTDSGAVGIHVTSLVVSGNYIYAVSETGLWKRSLSNMGVAAVAERNAGAPKAFALGQNYPNPFNPTTNISFTLPEQSFVSLKVYDIVGREVATLVNGEQTPGYKSVTWNASNVPSGMYFYRLQTKEFTQTRKLLLLK